MVFTRDRQPDRNGFIVSIWMGIGQARRARQGSVKGLAWPAAQRGHGPLTELGLDRLFGGLQGCNPATRRAPPEAVFKARKIDIHWRFQIDRLQLRLCHIFLPGLQLDLGSGIAWLYQAPHLSIGRHLS